MSQLIPPNMDWNDPIRRREIALQLLLSDPNVTAREKVYMLSALELVKAMEDFKPIDGAKPPKPNWPPTHTGDILGDGEKGCNGNCDCNDNY